jgi:hypothetical protein
LWVHDGREVVLVAELQPAVVVLEGVCEALAVVGARVLTSSRVFGLSWRSQVVAREISRANLSEFLCRKKIKNNKYLIHK